MRILGFYDGEIIDIASPAVPLEDRAHQFGDGVYEVIVAYRGEYFALKEHLDRLERSCRELEISPAYSRPEVEDFCQLLLKEAEMEEAMLYLQWSRGAAPRSHGFPADPRAILSGTIRPRKAPRTELLEKGVNVLVQPDERWLRCDIKSLNLLGSVLPKQKAIEAGCFEALLVRDGQYVTEGASSNCFCVREGVIYTTPACNLILAGVTRGIIIELAETLGFAVRQEFKSLEFYLQADEVFLTGTTTEVMPIVKLDEIIIGSGKPGWFTVKLQEAYLAKTGRTNPHL